MSIASAVSTESAARIDGRPAALEAQKFQDPHGFGPMARITTTMGQVYAQALRKGDRVKTKSGAFLPIVAIKRFVLDRDFFSRHPSALPILIQAGTFAKGIPATNILLAPNQEIHQSQAIMGSICDRAVDALSKPGVMRKTESMITYTSFHCGKPTAVLCEGLWMDTAP